MNESIDIFAVLMRIGNEVKPSMDTAGYHVVIHDVALSDSLW